MALTRGIIEVRKEEGQPVTGGANSSGQFEQRAFDLTTQDGLGGYWAQLAQMSVDYRSVFFPTVHHASHAIIHYPLT